METNNYFIPLLIRHLKLMGINGDPEELQLVLQSSPSFPSVLSIVQTYTYYGLKATACRADYLALEKVKLPAIALVRQDATEKFILIEKVSGEEVCYFDAFTNKKHEMRKEEFCSIWTKIVIILEETENTLYGNNRKSKISIYRLGLLVLCFLLPGLKINPDFENIFFFYGLLSLKLFGIGLCIGLLRQEAKGSYSFFDAFCHRNMAFDCDTVIHSKASKLFNKIALVDIGFVYFATGSISLSVAAFSGMIGPVLQILLYLAVCSTPFTLFSILYQKFVVRKWCPLCLSVIATLLAEVVLFLLYPDKILLFNPFSITGEILFPLLVSIGLLLLVKQNIQYKAKAFQKEISLLRVKRAPVVITNIFNSQQKLQSLPEDSLKLGNREAPITITTLLSPMCSSCRRIALQMVDLLERYPLFIQWHVRFDGTDRKEHENLNSVQFHIFTLFDRYRDYPERIEILKEWFRSQSMAKFEKIYPVKTITDQTKRAFYDQLKNNKIFNTDKVPSIWVNSYAFPKEYTLEDIPFLLMDLVNLSKTTR